MRFDDEKLPLMDLTGVTRPGVVTSITLDGYPRSEWIRCGVVVLQQQNRGPWRLGARVREDRQVVEERRRLLVSRRLPRLGSSLRKSCVLCYKPSMRDPRRRCQDCGRMVCSTCKRGCCDAAKERTAKREAREAQKRNRS